MEEGQLDMISETSRTRVRLFVGGLGESVTTDELRKIFSSLGDIESLDIIRSKGRSFAYIDFLPTSDKSLSKLLSTYNGCVWKGGRLRLEKAKEDYLTRLRREWTEDAEIASIASANNVDINAENNMELPEKTMKKLGSENKQLNIFFPRLRRVKSIPFSGTGKHKYSFRRVEVPPLPTYFCDCEEHSGPHTVVEKQTPIEQVGGGVNKEELDMMNSVMNKLFQREKVSNECAEIESASGKDSINAINDLQFDETEGESTADEDNLIINMVNGQESVFVTQKSRFNERVDKEAELAKEVLLKPRRNNMSPKKKKSVLSEENDAIEFVSGIHGDKGTSRGESEDPLALLGSQSIEHYSGTKRSASNVPWSQKSSWRELVGNRGNTGFNISDILPGISSSKEKSRSDNVPNSSSTKKKQKKKKNELRLEDHDGPLEEMEVMEGPATAQPSRSDNVPNSSSTKKKKKQKNELRLEDHDGPLEEMEVMEGPATAQPTRSDNVPNSSSTKNKKQKKNKLRLEDHDGPLEEMEVMEGPAIAQPTRSDNVPNSGGIKNKNVLGYEEHKAQLEEMEIVEGPAEAKPNQSDDVPDSNGTKKHVPMHEDHRCQPERMEIVEGPAEAQPIKSDLGFSGRGSAWLHECSWTQLVSGNNINSFNITQLLPGVSFEKIEPAKPDCEKGSNFIDHKHTVEEPKMEPIVNDTAIAQESSEQTVLGKNDASASVVEEKHDSEIKATTSADVISETCLFMRTAASLKEWSIAKAALSGTRKRRIDEK